jgi:formylglycine-generating enzyme required for sulfatase activity
MDGSWHTCIQFELGFFMFDSIRFNHRLAQGLLFPLAALLPFSAPAQTGKTYVNSIGMEFIQIPAGEFMMGCGSEDEPCFMNEKPQHRVIISQPFYLGKYEVTQEE